MKFMLLIYDNPDTRDMLGADEAMAEVDALIEELTRSGELVGGEALVDPSLARTVRPGGDGSPAVTDGPFAESKEHLGGYLTVDCESIDRAVEIAARWPNARFGAMEVRPVMDPAGTEL